MSNNLESREIHVPAVRNFTSKNLDVSQLMTFTLVDLEVLDTFSEVNLFRDDGDPQLPPVHTTELMVKPVPELADRKDTPLIGNVLCNLTDIDTGSQFSIFPRTVLITEADRDGLTEDRLCIRLEHCASRDLFGGTLVIHDHGLVELYPVFGYYLQVKSRPIRVVTL